MVGKGLKLLVITLIVGIYNCTWAQTWYGHVEVVNASTLQVEIILPTTQYDAMNMYFTGDSLFEDGFQPISNLTTQFLTADNSFQKFEENIPANPRKKFPVNVKNKSLLSYVVHFNPKQTFSPGTPVINVSDIRLINWNNILLVMEGFEEYNLELRWVEGGDTSMVGRQTFNNWLVSPTVYANSSNVQQYVLDDSDGSTLITNVDDKVGEELFNLVGEAIFAIKGCRKDANPGFEYVVLFDEGESKQGAIARNDMAIFQFSMDLLRQKDWFMIQKTLIHEMLHLYIPEPKWAFVNPSVGALWREEAMAEYLALKYMLKSGLLSDQEYLLAMENKARASLQYYYEDMNEWSVLAQNDVSRYDAFYTRGVLMLWQLDAIIYSSTNGELQLEDYLEADFSALSSEVKVNLIREIGSFFHLSSGKSYNPNFHDWIYLWGLAYESKRLEYFYKTEELVFVFKDKYLEVVETGSLGLFQEGDLVIKVNGKKEASQMMQFFQEPPESFISCLILRNDKKMKIFIPKQEELVKIITESFQMSGAVSDEQKMNWERYIN